MSKNYTTKREQKVSPIPWKDYNDIDEISAIPNGPVQDDKPISLDTLESKFMPYFTKIKEQIESVWVFPHEATSSGSSIVQFYIRKDGSLEKALIYSSSGEEYLDKEAVQSVINASPFPPVPEEIGKDSLNVLAKFSYEMNFVSQ